MFLAIILFFSTAVYAESNVEMADESVQVESLSVDSSPCFKSYQAHRNHWAIASGLAPIVGVSEVVGSAMAAFSFEYGGMAALKAGALGSAAEVAFSTVIPLVAVGSFVGMEAFTITKFTLANHAYHLMKDLYGIGYGKRLNKFIRSVQKDRPDLSAEQITQQLIAADQSEDLCNGNWGKRKIAMIPAIKKHLIKSPDLENQNLVRTI